MIKCSGFSGCPKITVKPLRSAPGAEDYQLGTGVSDDSNQVFREMRKPPIIIVQLVHLHGPLKGEIQEFTEPVIAIGRHSTSIVRFPADLGIISRKHAEIRREGNRFKLVDLSTNGTLVNGKPVKEVYLKDGDVLTFAEGGPKVSFLTQVKEDVTEVESIDEVPAKSEEAPPAPSLRQTPHDRPHLVDAQAIRTDPALSASFAPGDLSPASPPATPAPPAPEQAPRGSRSLRVEEPPPRAQARDARFEDQEAVEVQPAIARLVFQYGPTLRSFERLPVTIGRHPNCQVRIEHPAVLDMHAQIFFHQNRYWVKDLTGRGIIQLNGRPINTQAPLEVDDILAFSPRGPVFKFLGEGRLAEAEEQSPDTGASEEKVQEPRADSQSRKPAQEHKSLLKRFLH